MLQLQKAIDTYTSKQGRYHEMVQELSETNQTLLNEVAQLKEQLSAQQEISQKYQQSFEKAQSERNTLSKHRSNLHKQFVNQHKLHKQQLDHLNGHTAGSLSLPQLQELDKTLKSAQQKVTTAITNINTVCVSVCTTGISLIV
jgi:chromosome segregation ATPase